MVGVRVVGYVRCVLDWPGTQTNAYARLTSDTLGFQPSIVLNAYSTQLPSGAQPQEDEEYFDEFVEIPADARGDEDRFKRYR